MCNWNCFFIEITAFKQIMTLATTFIWITNVTKFDGFFLSPNVFFLFDCKMSMYSLKLPMDCSKFQSKMLKTLLSSLYILRFEPFFLPYLFANFFLLFVCFLVCFCEFFSKPYHIYSITLVLGQSQMELKGQSNIFLIGLGNRQVHHPITAKFLVVWKW